MENVTSDQLRLQFSIVKVLNYKRMHLNTFVLQFVWQWKAEIEAIYIHLGILLEETVDS